MSTPQQLVEETLSRLQIPYTLVEHPAVYTMEEIQRLSFPGREKAVKNLFLRDDKKRSYYLVVLPGQKTADLKRLQEQIPSRKLSFASEADLAARLGLLKGSVPPLGILNDREHTVQVVLDRQLLAETEVGVHPNRNDATLLLAPGDLVRVIRDQGNPLVLVDL